jgi:hypothetical protein
VDEPLAVREDQSTVAVDLLDVAEVPTEEVPSVLTAERQRRLGGDLFTEERLPREEPLVLVVAPGCRQKTPAGVQDARGFGDRPLRVGHVVEH